MAFLQTAFNYLAEHWEFVLLAVGIVISLAQLASKYWSEHTGLTRWLAFLIEALSIFTSSGSRTTAQPILGRLKLPGQFVPPPTVTGAISSKPPSALLLLFLLLPMLGACTSFTANAETRLQQLHAGLKAVRPIGREVFRDVCRAKAESCREARLTAEQTDKACTTTECHAKATAAISTARTCESLRKCHGARDVFDGVLVSGQLLIMDGLAALGLTDAIAEKKLAGIFTAIVQVIAAAQKSIAEIQRL